MSPPTPLSADLALTGGKVATINPRQPYAEAIAIGGQRIIAVGSGEEIKALIGKATRVIELEGKLALPGFNDAHIHFIEGGLSLLKVNLRGVTTIKEFQKRVKERASSLPARAWITGGGWDHESLPGGTMPTKEILDAIAPHNPVLLSRLDLHTYLANSKALEMAGITGDTPQPAGGEIIKDPATGEPTGILKEKAADLALRVVPPPSPERRLAAAREALKEARRYGVTSIHDNTTAADREVYRHLRENGELTARVYALLRDRPTGERTGMGDELFKIGAEKGFIDGALGSSTALLFKPYADGPTTRGLAQVSQAALKEAIREAHRKGMQVAWHAIGDAANRMALDAIEAALREVPRRDHRHRIEHAQVLAPADIPRFAQLSVIASMQPAHCISDMPWTEARLGAERAKWAYVFRSLLDSGARIAFGTDWPVDSLNPMKGLYAAVTRQSLRGEPKGGWHPEQRLTMEEALRLYTLGSAYASFEEGIKGSIEPGKLADIAILSEDLTAIDADEIKDVTVCLTMVGGTIAWRASS